MKPVWVRRGPGARVALWTGAAAAVAVGLVWTEWRQPATVPPSSADPVAVPATQAPATQAPATQAPAPQASATQAPATEAPATEAPAPLDPATPAASTAAPPAATAAPSTPQSAPPPQPAPSAEPAVAPPAAAAPAFDVVRIESDGSALVAGRAPRGAEVAVLVDGTEVGSTTADAANRFALLFALPADAQPRQLSLSMVAADGARRASTETVLVAPIRSATTPAPTAQPATTALPASPAALLVGETGVRVLQPAGEQVDEAPAGISVDTISYASDGAVLLAGRSGGGDAVPGDVVRLYLDNRESATLPVAADGSWSASLTGIEPGLYQLRADRISAEGKVVARFETPFARETRETVAAALQARTTPAVTGAEAPPSAPVAETPPAPGPSTPAAASVPLTVTVQPGYSLWRIARASFGNGVLYVKVYEANRAAIRDPDLIYPGQVFTLPQPGP